MHVYFLPRIIIFLPKDDIRFLVSETSSLPGEAKCANVNNSFIIDEYLKENYNVELQFLHAKMKINSRSYIRISIR